MQENLTQYFAASICHRMLEAGMKSSIMKPSIMKPSIVKSSIMKPSIRIIALLVVMLAVFAARGDACSCAGPEPPCEAYQSSVAVFIGTMMDVSNVTVELKAGDRRLEFMGKLFRFSVEQAFKGVEEAEIEIQTGSGGGDCGYEFRKGDRYLVYAYKAANDKRLSTNICSRTRPLSHAADDLAFLRGLPQSATSTRISGTIAQYDNDPTEGYHFARFLSGIKVTITSQKGSHEIYTNDDGVYEITGLPAGRYKIQIELPSNLSIPDYRRAFEVQLRANGCAGGDIVAHSDGKISRAANPSKL